MRFFILGDEDVVLAFRFAGVDGVIALNSEEVNLEFDKICKEFYGEVGVLIITEKNSLLLGDKLLEWELTDSYPLIVEIPDMDGHIEGKKSMLETIRKAIGLSV
ncbi:MAG TPA: V-type ATP synthase subunit F [Spirochaetota bacterium]|nr:V-type ATP synthase subunit F [Spirochaetota bacterium]